MRNYWYGIWWLLCSTTLGVWAQTAPTIFQSPTNLFVLNGGNATFSVGVSGTPPFNYQWFFNGQPIFNNLITTVAGGGTSGDGGPAIAASLNWPQGCVLDAQGNLYIADQSQRVHRMATNGVITVYAGNGTATYGGDGGPATNASLQNPQSLCLDAVGNLYIADRGNHRVRKVTRNGLISTVAGNGTPAFSGDGGPGTNASLNDPLAVAVDPAGNLIIADSGNGRVRRLTPGGIITTIAGTNQSGYAGDGGPATGAVFSTIFGLGCDATGNIYLADTYNNRIRKIDAAGNISTIAGNGAATFAGDGGPAVNGSIYWPIDAKVDTYGNCFVSDLGNNRVREINASGVITTIAGNGQADFGGDGGPAPNAALRNVFELACDVSGNVYICDAANGRVREVAFTGRPVFPLFSVGPGQAGTYFVIVTNAAGSATSAAGSLTIVYPPVITNPPAGYGVLRGTTANLSVGVTGTPPFTCFWYLNGTNLLQAGSSPNLAVPNFDDPNVGTYSVIVSNAYTGTVSPGTTLTIGPLPAIVTQPQDQYWLDGTNGTLQVSATGLPPLTYYWYFNGSTLLQAGPNTSLVITNYSEANAGSYQVVVSNRYAGTVSQSANVTTVYPPSITSDLFSQTNFVGSNTTFQVTVSGTGPFNYHWQLNGTNLSNNTLVTVAGDGTAGGGGDGNEPLAASVAAPSGLVFDANQNLYISDATNSRVRISTANGYGPYLTTYVGYAVNGTLGDGASALAARLASPAGLALATNGNLYIADANDQRVRIVRSDGNIYTFAGGATTGFCGDGGPATNACLHAPVAVALDAPGNVYIADQLNNVIRKVATNGFISTIAGALDNSAGYSGDGGSALGSRLNNPASLAWGTNHDLIIADSANHRLRRISATGLISTLAGNGVKGYTDAGGVATNASFNFPVAVLGDGSGNFYVADQQNHRVRRIDARGGITTVAGNGTAAYTGEGDAGTNASLNQPSALALDSLGNLYIGDKGNNRVRELAFNGLPSRTILNLSSNTDGAYTVVVSSPYGSVTSSPALLTSVSRPFVITQPVSQPLNPGANATLSVTAGGTPPLNYTWYFNRTPVPGPAGSATNLAITNFGPANVGFYSVVIANDYGSITSQVAAVYQPLSVSVLASNSIVLGADLSLDPIISGSGPYTCQWRLNGTNLPLNLIQTVAGSGATNYSGDGGPATSAGLDFPRGLTVTHDGSVYIADTLHFAIRQVSPAGLISTYAGNHTNSHTGDGGPAARAGLSIPYDVAPFGNAGLIIAEYGSNCVRFIDTNTLVSTLAGTGVANFAGDGGPATQAALNRPTGVVLVPGKGIYVADNFNNRLRLIATNGTISTVAGKTGGYGGDNGAATNASLSGPLKVTADAAGNVYIADQGNNRIRKVSTNGVMTTAAGNGNTAFSGDNGAATAAALNNIGGATVDLYGNLYIADTLNQRIRKVGTNGIITTVAGNGTAAFAGDGGPATNASLYRPYAVATDAAGNLLIADTYNQRIRKVALAAGYPSLKLINSGTNQTGNYTLVVSSPYASITSAVYSVTVHYPAPQLPAPGTLFSLVSNRFGFNYSALAGQTVVLEASTNFLSWTPVATNLFTNSPVFYSDPKATNFPRRFYRAKSVSP